MRGWIRKHPLAFGINISVVLIILAAVAILSAKINGAADQMMSSQPLFRQTRIYVGENLSTTATAITGATVHMGYADFIKHSREATETYLVRGKGPDEEYLVDRAYALLGNGHTYSTEVPIREPRFYKEDSRQIDKGRLIVRWRLDPYRPDLWELFFWFLILWELFFWFLIPSYLTTVVTVVLAAKPWLI